MQQKIWECWGTPESRSPAYVYYTNSANSILLVKPNKLREAQEKFARAGVEVRATGVRYIGAAIGSSPFKRDDIIEKFQTWVAEIKSSSAFAQTQRQVACAAFVHAMTHTGKWTFVARAPQEALRLFTELEQAIDGFFISALSDCPPVSKEERQILSLPCRNSDLELIYPT